VSGSQTPTSARPTASGLHREEYLAERRGIAPIPGGCLPTPAPSNCSRQGGVEMTAMPSTSSPIRENIPVIYDATTVRTGKVLQWQAVRTLGTGTFSTVMLASSDLTLMTCMPLGISYPDPSLVAVKICQHGPAGGADKKKLESSLKRELDILKAVNHPSVIRLRASNSMETQTLFVLNYCPGGDLFELASLRQELLGPGMIQRIFAELVRAVRYLHGLWIVHRDIKLESTIEASGGG